MNQPKACKRCNGWHSEESFYRCVTLPRPNVLPQEPEFGWSPYGLVYSKEKEFLRDPYAR